MNQSNLNFSDKNPSNEETDNVDQWWTKVTTESIPKTDKSKPINEKTIEKAVNELDAYFDLISR